MDFNLSDTQRLLLDSAERYLAARFTLVHRRSLRAVADGLDRDAWRQFAELGWLALAIPEEHGGLGGTMEDVAVLSAALGGRIVTEPFASTAVLSTHILAHAETPRAELLGAIAGGDLRIALAHDEPGERYAYSAARAARVAPYGKGLALTGQKMLAADAPSADKLIVTAYTDADEFALVLVDAGAKGVTQTAYALVDDSRGADIRFDNVALAPDAILARGKAARSLMSEAIDRTTICLLAQAVGSMDAVIAICSAYLKERQQFGQAIGKFQALQHIMADLFVATHQSRSALYHALANVDGPEETRARAVSLAKLRIAEASQLVSRQAVQLHGGYGIADEFEVSHHYRRLLVIEKLYGDIDFHVRRLGKG